MFLEPNVIEYKSEFKKMGRIQMSGEIARTRLCGTVYCQEPFDRY